MRQGVGILLVVGGAALAWLLKRKVGIFAHVHRPPVRVGSKNGTCGLVQPVPSVQMDRHDQLHWMLTNTGGHCGDAVEICITNWSPSNPLEDMDPSARPFCRRVRVGHPPLPLRARVRQGASTGNYWYHITVDGRPAVDPMVEIVF